MSVCRDRSGELLPEYVHGLLDPEEMKRIADHLEGCLECASQLRVISQLEDEILPEPPAWFWTSLPGKVTAQVEARRRGKARILIPVWAGGLAAAAIAVIMLLQPGSAPQLQTDVPDYSVAETTDSFPFGLEEEILSVSGMYIDDLDQTLGLDLKGVSGDIMVTMDLVLEGDGYETMDEDTIKVFEDLVEEMTPERVRKRVIS
jgi:hypothetical protein